MNFKYRLTDLGRGIFLLEFRDRYDLAMSFLRLQEFYESDSEEFRGKHFRLLDYIEWYSKNNNNKFTYPADWSGFNLPAHVFYNLYKYSIEDVNKYDHFMKSVYEFITRNTKGDFYLIGALEGDSNTMRHECSHALFSLDKDYREAQLENLDGLGSRDKVYKVISDLGYGDNVLPDEAQAYLSTGVGKKIKAVLNNEKTDRKPFIETFEKFSI